MNALTRTDYQFPGQTKVYHGKVRDCYFINDEYMVMVATDRISAFDVILPKGIPYKGQVLNQIAAMFLDPRVSQTGCQPHTLKGLSSSSVCCGNRTECGRPGLRLRHATLR